MKYFLAIDKGHLFKNNERFTKINLETIHEKLGQENNLQALCTFTVSFANELELKMFLEAKGLLKRKNLHSKLVITYFKDYNHFSSIPYAKDKQFLDYHYLEKIIYENAKKPEFLQHLIKSYANYKHVASQLYSFRVYLSNPYEDYKLYDVVRNFVSKIVLRDKQGKSSINYKGLYDLGMFVAKLITPPEIKQAEKVQPITFKDSLSEEEDPTHFHLIELKERYEKDQDDQMRLF